MQKLSYVVILLFIITNVIISQTSPHGEEMKIECNVCHSTESWSVSDSKFDHSTTEFELIGQHQDVSCQSCHTTLKFNEAESDCQSCHVDIHENSVGFDCARCHASNSWIVTDVEEIHRMSRFPLLGTHKIADCNECHESNTLLNFKPLGVTCYDCHISDYQATTAPNHIASNYSTDCEECHSINSVSWGGAGIVHDFFPLTGGHDIDDCYSCHQPNSFEGLSQDCNSCHSNDYNNTTNPSHVALGFSTDCQECHNINGWKPATFDHDTRFFPIYSGEHNGEWDECSDCHTNSNDYALFSCLSCHEHNQTDMNDEHSGISGYVYESNACFACHPTGSEDGSFSHTQAFPLIGSHSNATCSDCHETSYSSTSSECVACHQANFDNAQNPNHVGAGISQQCEACHTATDWAPSTFSHVSTGFELLGNHATVDCADCHEGNTTTAVQECSACHQADFDNALNPNHKLAGISLECEVCHSSTDWVPSSFSHATTGFELLGSHATVDCSDCHEGNTNSAVQDCFSCHEDKYNSAKDHLTQKFPVDCQICHNVVSWEETTFEHNTTNFPLTGAHINSDCGSCHIAGYAGTNTECSSCHQTNFDNAQNPNHIISGISLKCEECHSTTNWVPSSFSHATTGYELLGSHATVDCADCHEGNTANAVQDCFSCHENEYNNAQDHLAQNFPIECEMCHNTVTWIETTFNHSTTNFPLTGEHVNSDCSDCHSSGYANTSTECLSCHQIDFDNSTNPNHQSLGLSTDCSICHTTVPGWEPAEFPDHNNYFQLVGAHATIANICIDCHDTGYNNTPIECIGCHETNYNNTNNPSHTAAQFSTECELCHTENAWSPSTFDHDTQYFPIYSGNHQDEWNECFECHTTQNNYSLFSCIDCHEHSNKTEVDDDHNEVNDYVYESTACYDCHPNGDEDDSGIPNLKIQNMH